MVCAVLTYNLVYKCEKVLEKVALFIKLLTSFYLVRAQCFVICIRNDSSVFVLPEGQDNAKGWFSRHPLKMD